ncbi:MAG TPA: hypothetical protein VGE05_14435, partial [Novosphingobium sp.]
SLNGLMIASIFFTVAENPCALTRHRRGGPDVQMPLLLSIKNRARGYRMPLGNAAGPGKSGIARFLS